MAKNNAAVEKLKQDLAQVRNEPQGTAANIESILERIQAIHLLLRLSGDMKILTRHNYNTHLILKAKAANARALYI